MFDALAANFADALKHPLPLLLAQLALILAVAAVFGRVARRFGQPSVIGEMAAGIALGPSLLGNLFPALESALFPPASIGNLSLLSQVGVLLFLFSMGMEIDLAAIRRHARTAVFVSNAGIVAPFALGAAAAWGLHAGYAPPGVGKTAFVLFMGIAMSITAFPVLARILTERGLIATPLGSTAMASAAADDITAWILLAAVICVAKAQSVLSVIPVAGAALAFTAFMLFAVRPAARRIPTSKLGDEPRRAIVAVALLVMFLSSLATEAIGIHALFGAFLAGVVMPPQPGFRAFLRARLEYPASLFLLPVFFACTGLRTRIDGIAGWGEWALCAGLIAIAIAGKLGGVGLAARATGSSWRDALSLGALMNTRGLMELIVLNVGLDLGILSQRLFTMMVLMALLTTMMTGPMLTWIQGWRKAAPEVSPGSGAVAPRGSGSP